MNQIYYERGVKVNPLTGSVGKVVMRTETQMYKDVYMVLDKIAKRVYDAVIHYMTEDLNTIQPQGEVLDGLVLMTGYEKNTVQKAVGRLSKLGLVEKTDLRGEYIVNPMVAYKGNEYRVWEMYRVIEENKK